MRVARQIEAAMRPRSANRARAIAAAERQDGVISRGQLLALGVPARTIQHWRDSGVIHDLHRGVYAWGHRAVSWRGRCLAAQLAGGEGAAVSHASAAVLHGLIPARPTIDVISPKRRNDDDTLRIHCVELHDGETAHMDGVRVTTIARTLFDLCDRRLIAEAVARGLTTLEALEDFAERKRGARGAVQFAEAIGLPQYRSRFERCFHRWLRRRGFPEPELNLKVGRHTYDFVWCPHGVIVETDGPHHRTPAQRAVDEQVDREAAAHGYRVVRVAEEGFAARRDRVAALIWTALAAV